MKEFKTFNQQLKILRSRGMTVPTDGKPKRFLERENYYNVINGYKDLFLQKDQNDHPLIPETYIPGCHFNELKALFLFDRELRILFLEYILKFESAFKTVYAYEFSKQYPSANSYLDLSNYTKDYPESVVKQIHYLTGTIKDKATKEGAIKHYISTHESVPLWVLVNYLTLGNMSYLYSVLKDREKSAIAKVFSDRFNQHCFSDPGSSNPKPNSLRLAPKDLIAALKILGLIRNQCAHDERLYNTKYKNVYVSNIKTYLNASYCPNDRLSVAFLYLKVLLDKTDYSSFKKRFLDLEKKYRPKFTTVSFDLILNSMGIDNNFLKNM